MGKCLSQKTTRNCAYVALEGESVLKSTGGGERSRRQGSGGEPTERPRAEIMIWSSLLEE